MIRQSLKDYIEKDIIPQYQAFDGAHQPDHVYQVIANSLKIAESYDVNVEMVYTIAAYHDIGLRYGRKGHESESRKIINEDLTLKNFFSEEEIKVMGEAAEDHRASLVGEPRSIYGKIVAEADRDINLERLLTRSIQFQLDHHPHYTQEENYAQVHAHILEKYGENSTMKLWLNNETNVRELEKVQEILQNDASFFLAYINVYHSLKEKQNEEK